MASYFQGLRNRNIFDDVIRQPMAPGGIGIANIMRDVIPTLLQENQRDRDHDVNMLNLRMPRRLDAIGEDILNPVKQKPMNVVYQPSQAELMKPVSAYQKAQLELQEGKLRGAADSALLRDKTANRNLDIKEKQLDINRLKAENPNMKFTTDGETIRVFNPRTGEIRDTGIATGNLSDAERLAIEHANQTAQITQKGKQVADQITQRGDITSRQITERGDESKELESTRQAGRESLAETRGWEIGTIPDPKDPTKQIAVQYHKITGEVKPIQFNSSTINLSKVGTANNKDKTVKPQSELEKSRAAINKAITVKNSNPKFNDWIKIKGNDITLETPGFFGPSQEEYDDMYRQIFGSASPAASGSSGSNQPIYKTQRNKNTGATRRLMSTDGGKTWQPVK